MGADDDDGDETSTTPEIRMRAADSLRAGFVWGPQQSLICSRALDGCESVCLFRSGASRRIKILALTAAPDSTGLELERSSLRAAQL